MKRILKSGCAMWTSRCSASGYSQSVDLSEEVKSAMDANRPIVALETTIVTHGMPYPHNIETATAVEDIVRQQGAVPATVGILRGRVKVGLTLEQLSVLAEPGSGAVKTSRRDFPYVLSNKLNGGTTVSGTIVVASMLGIKVFVTGGIGGVHRGGESSLDVSADLTELGRSGTMVVSSGVKSILDVGRTLEYLETEGVCVVSYGPSREFPGFYSATSGHLVPYNVTTPHEAASLIHSLCDLGLLSGLLLAVPVPHEHALHNNAELEATILAAVFECEQSNIRGKEVTPYILSRISHLTLETNKALIKNNARIGSQIAVELASMNENVCSNLDTNNNAAPKIKPSEHDSAPQTWNQNHVLGSASEQPVVIGGCNLDCIVSLQEKLQTDGRTVEGCIGQSGGGVGRNLADALGKLNYQPLLISAVGDDLFGSYLISTISHLCTKAGVRVCEDSRTACYTVLLDQSGECRIGIGDMTIHSRIDETHVMAFNSQLSQSPLVIIDGNVPKQSFNSTLDFCSRFSVPVWFEPTDVTKAASPFGSERWKTISIASPNLNELRRMAATIGIHGHGSEVDRHDTEAVINEAIYLGRPLAEHISLVITLGSLGVLVMRSRDTDTPLLWSSSARCPVKVNHYADSAVTHLVNVSGAGDCLAAGFISAMLAGLSEAECVSSGLAAAADSLLSMSAVPNVFTQRLPEQLASIKD